VQETTVTRPMSRVFSESKEPPWEIAANASGLAFYPRFAGWFAEIQGRLSGRAGDIMNS
jgi:hypothetical protein